VDAGTLSERQVGRTMLIRANGESPLVKPLREILTVATGPLVILAKELARINGIESAFLYGSFVARMLGDAGPAPHDITSWCSVSPTWTRSTTRAPGSRQRCIVP
jgi:hypothetical protein